MKDNNPLVSILTNTYNRCDLIHRCIESIQNQSYKNYEHIIVDGNSTDETETVVKAYNDPRIKYIKLDTRGPEVQMKAGSAIAKGKYVTFLDDDDEYMPNKLEKQVALFETEPDEVGVVYCWMSYYNNDKPDVVINVHKTELKGDVSVIAPTRPLVCGTPTMMIRRDVFEKVGGAYDDSYGYIGSDWELMTRVCQLCQVDYVPESLVKVYVNHGHARLSTDFYQDKARKGIVFHNHFLNEYSEVFKKYPKSADFHYSSLCKCYATLKERKNAFKYWKLYLGTKPTFKKSLVLLRDIFF